MKKKIILMLPLLLLMGCVKLESNPDNYKISLDYVLSNNNNNVNRASTGYKYYLPQGVKLIDNNDFNQTFKYLDTNIYMYVDVISYYYKSKIDYSNVEQNNNFYLLDHNDKKGYLIIKQENYKYFVKIIYNYAKIEVYASEENINQVVTLCSILINSIKFNDTIIKSIIDNSISTYTEISYDLDKPDDSKSNFNQYLEEYVQEENDMIELPN